jgi:outer membrane receptor for ferrienterochelin and colicin
MDVAAVEQNRMARTALGSDTTKVYFVDGRQATSEEARAIAPEQIASIEVEKHGAPGVSSVRITTRAAANRSMSDTASLLTTVGLRMESGETSAVRSMRALEGNSTVIVFIDGVKSDATTLRRIAPASIEAIEVIKGAAATQRFKDPAAANGVILVTTKKS